MPSFDPYTHLLDFRKGYHNMPNGSSRPNWMEVTFTKELAVHGPVVVVIDHKSEPARKALGAIIQHLWLSCENWTLVTKRPKP